MFGSRLQIYILLLQEKPRDWYFSVPVHVCTWHGTCKHKLHEGLGSRL